MDPAPPAASLPAPCVEAIEQAGLSEWGFHIFRTTYEDDAKWSLLKTRITSIIDEQLTPSNGDGIETVRDALRIEWVESPERLRNADAAAVRQYYAELLQSPTFPASMEMPAVLMVDSAAMDSVVNYAPVQHPPQTPLQTKRRNAPWLWAVDVDHESLGDEDDTSDDDYRGILKVAVYCLINDLFPVMATRTLGLGELLPSDGDDEIWFSTYNPY